MVHSAGQSAPLRLVERNPEMSAADLLEYFHPPAQFAHASLDNYVPDPNYPSQQDALIEIQQFSVGGTFRPSGAKSWFGKSKVNPDATERPGIYLDGGFGVGKTHLLAALWHSTPGRTYYGTFIEYTALVGALSYQGAVEHLKGADFLAIDEFELDDPGDTMVMSRLLGELVATGTRLAATSNTPPNALGEGRFAAGDFLREITALSDKFRTVRIEGEDYRKRDFDGHAVSFTADQLDRCARETPGMVTRDVFAQVVDHLRLIHPSRFVGLVRDLDMVIFDDVQVLHDQAQALRLVALVDRLYDQQVAIAASGIALDEVFDETMLSGGYRKKYLRATSRMIALSRLVETQAL
ncbi:MAG: cell division protein ZapE [Pontimonas sp.]